MAVKPQDILSLTEQNIRAMYHTEPAKADAHQLHNALGRAVMALIAPDWMRTNSDRAGKRQGGPVSCRLKVKMITYDRCDRDDAQQFEIGIAHWFFRHLKTPFLKN